MVFTDVELDIIICDFDSSPMTDPFVIVIVILTYMYGRTVLLNLYCCATCKVGVPYSYLGYACDPRR